MNINEFFKALSSFGDRPFLHQQDRTFTYADLLEQMEKLENLYLDDVPQGSVISIESDFSLQSIAFLVLALKKKLICMPLLRTDNETVNIEKAQKAHVEFRFIEKKNGFDKVKCQGGEHPYITNLIEQEKAGLIMFSTGSTGFPKAALHDFERQLLRFPTGAKARNLVLFLFFDHLGGIHTLLHVLTTGGRAVILNDYSPATVFEAISKHQIEILPTSPTFLQLALFSGVIKPKDLSSLKVISYGTEPMTTATLKRILKIFPDKKVLQTYGTTETGSIRIENHPHKLNWFKIADPNVSYKIKDDILFIKTKLAMIGYLEGDSPFDEEGYYNTQDCVLKEGDYLLIVGRKNDVVNIGGQKVIPLEVEEVLMSVPGIVDATVYGVSHPITGHVLQAMIQIEENFTMTDTAIKKFCAQKLSFYKVPLEFERYREALPSIRNKKVRTFKE